jgi:hypothetical protein
MSVPTAAQRKGLHVQAQRYGSPSRPAAAGDDIQAFIAGLLSHSVWDRACSSSGITPMLPSAKVPLRKLTA